MKQLRFALVLLMLSAPAALAHPLGNFTINHFVRLEVGSQQIRVRFVVDMAEIATLQQLQAVDADHDGAPSTAELNTFADRAAPEYGAGLVLTVDGARVPLRLVDRKVGITPGAGGLPTLRLQADYVAPVAAAPWKRVVRFEDRNHPERIGWHEIVVVPADGITVFDSTAFGSGVTDELKAYPQDMLAVPLDERSAEFSIVRGPLPPGRAPLLTRAGRPAAPVRDRLAELIAAAELTPGAAFLGFLFAFFLGAGHAFSPGHGKTVVGAYLIGSRGTARHALFLGLTVTVTHTAGVFALGLVTLFAARYVLPERLFPILELLSGAIMLALGLTLFFQRLHAALGHDDPELAHTHSHADTHAHTHSHSHSHPHAHPHSHAEPRSHSHAHPGALPHSHSHLPPGADGAAVSWRSLLALGVSGGLLPCPSALIVLLAAVALGRVAYGLLLVAAFSLGLAATLTAIGLLFLYLGRVVERRRLLPDWLARTLPVGSALVISVIGAVLCLQTLLRR